jgi:glycine cleavage system H protein
MADANYPDDVLYHVEHDWARLDGDTATFGITWFAQDSLGEISFFDPPAVGTAVTQGESYSEIESVKTVSELYAPLSGEIVQVNDLLGTAPETVNDDPYGQGWLVKVRLSDPDEAGSLLSAEEYRARFAE